MTSWPDSPVSGTHEGLGLNLSIHAVWAIPPTNHLMLTMKNQPALLAWEY